MNWRHLYLVLTVAATSLCAGCSSTDSSAQQQSKGYFQSYQRSADPTQQNVSLTIRAAVQNMLENGQYIDAQTTVAVADFVTLTANYEQPGMLGRYLSQVYLNELHRVGLTTVDFQVTDSVRVTPEGNLGLSQDYLELANSIDASSLMVGVITPGTRGYIVHARIVDIQSNKVIASAESFIDRNQIKRSLYGYY